MFSIFPIPYRRRDLLKSTPMEEWFLSMIFPEANLVWKMSFRMLTLSKSF